MKFGKTYNVLLPSFPQTWQERAISYSQLKKLINGVVDELSLLGLDPAVLHDLMQDGSEEQSVSAPLRTASLIAAPSRQLIEDDETSSSIRGSLGSVVSDIHNSPPTATHAVYELHNEGEEIIPRLRLTLAAPKSPAPTSSSLQSPPFHRSLSLSSSTPSALDSGSDSLEPPSIGDDDEALPPSVVMASNKKYVSQQNTIFALQNQHLQRHGSGSSESIQTTVPDSRNSEGQEDGEVRETNAQREMENRFLEDVDITIPFEEDPLVSPDPSSSQPHTHNEVIIPLNNDTAFYRVLISALQSLAEHQTKIQQEFTNTVSELSSSISSVSRPSPSSLTSTTSSRTSDLYAWRSIFQLWVDSEIFESMSERDRGERSIEDSERRLTQFADKVVNMGFLADKHGRSASAMRKKESKSALERFMQINVLLLDLRKFGEANAEATRKIMKKHDKRTQLLFPRPSQGREQAQLQLHPLLLAALTPKKPSHGMTLPHLLVVMLTDTLLPVIPSIDDYACLICTSIAYIPIRLQCSHLFCVRCLVKMQKRGQAECPLCRCPCVLQADRRNVDAALKRFMKEWFPKESKEKDKANQKEAAFEQAAELGLDDPGMTCCVM